MLVQNKENCKEVSVKDYDKMQVRCKSERESARGRSQMAVNYHRAMTESPHR